MLQGATSLDELILTANSKLRKLSLPDNLATLSVLEMKRGSITALPPGLLSLELGYVKLVDPSITIGGITSPNLMGVTFPAGPTYLGLYNSQLTQIPGTVSSTSVTSRSWSSAGTKFARSRIGCWQMPGHCEGVVLVPLQVELDDNPIPPEEIIRVQGLINRPGYTGPITTFDMERSEASGDGDDDGDGSASDEAVDLDTAVALWEQGIRFALEMSATDPGSSSSSTSSSSSSSSAAAMPTQWSTFADGEGAQEFARFLQRLSRTALGKNDKGQEHVGQMLLQFAQDADLRNAAFQLTRDANESCGDRVMLTFAKLQMLPLVRQVETGKLNGDLATVMHIARGVFCLDKLEKIARAKVATMNMVDEVEVYLSYVHNLHERLNLPGIKPPMVYDHISGVTEEDHDKAFEKVTAELTRNFLPFLASWDPWLKVLEALQSDEYKRVRLAPYLDLDKVMQREQDATAAIKDSGGDLGKDLANKIKQLADPDITQGIIDLTRKVLQSRGLEVLPAMAQGVPSESSSSSSSSAGPASDAVDRGQPNEAPPTRTEAQELQDQMMAYGSANLRDQDETDLEYLQRTQGNFGDEEHSDEDETGSQ